MLILKGLDIEIHRGDTGSIRITFTGEDRPEDGTIALVTVKTRTNPEEVVWKKGMLVSNYGCVIPLTTEETLLDVGVYRWDLRLIYTDGSVYTPMNPARYTVLETIGNAEEVNDSG